jgi:hypothetical protein
MDNCYNELFEPLCDSENIYYHSTIPTIDINVLRNIIEKDIDIINSSTLTPQQWARFKWSLLDDEKIWGVTVFKWTLSNTAYPYIGIELDWSVLENKSSRYFQIHMSFENVWMGDNRLCNIWEVIPADL